MKKFVQVVIVLSLMSSVLVAKSSIRAMKVLGDVSGIGPTSRAWLSASYADVILYPLTSINTNTDKQAKKARVKAIYDGKNISFFIKWKDDTKSVQGGYLSTAYGDGYAMQFPVDYQDASKLPYVDMGSKGRAVVTYVKKVIGGICRARGQDTFWKPFEMYRYETTVNTNYERAYMSEGHDSRKLIQNNITKTKMQMIYRNGYWRGTLSRPMKSSYLNLDDGAFPIVFTIWDGDDKDNLKLISGWTSVKMVGKKGGEKLVDALNEKPKGDIENGKKLAFENCAACHRYADANMAPAFMSPNLSNIGGYSASEYLMESMVSPSAVVVVQNSTIEHKNFSWYEADEDGVKTSTMPAYDWLDQKSRDDLVAYFKTLKGIL